VAAVSSMPAMVCDNIDQLLQQTLESVDQHSAGNGQRVHIVIMSNGGFEGFHQRLVAALNQ